MAGFIGLGTAQFAGSRIEFSSNNRLFETMWGMLLGNLPPSGNIPSTLWSHDNLMLVFVLLYNCKFLCCLLLVTCPLRVAMTHHVFDFMFMLTFIHELTKMMS